MARFVRFPGLAGSFAATLDDNLVDADTAHMFQSIGDWQFSTVPAVQQALAAAFSGFAARATATADDQTVQIGPGVNRVTAMNVPAVEGDQLHISISLANSADVGLRIFARYNDSSDVELGTAADSGTINTAAGTVRMELDCGVAPATTAYLTYQVQMRNGGGGFEVTDGDTVDIYDVAVRADGSNVFVPSLRIVGDFEANLDFVVPSPIVNAEVWNRWNNSAALRGWRFQTNSSNAGGMFFDIFVGGVVQNINATAFPIPRDRRFVAQVTRDATTGDLEILHDGVSQLVTNRATGAADVGVGQLIVGVRQNEVTAPFLGDIYSAEMKDGKGADGLVVARFDAEDVPVS